MATRETTTAALLGLALALSGCAATADSALEPQAAASPTVVTVVEPDSPETPSAAPSDGYPTFAAPLSAAASQMSNDEAAALQGRLTALGAARREGTVSEAEYRRRLEELRRLAAEHGAEAEAQIGN